MPKRSNPSARVPRVPPTPEELERRSNKYGRIDFVLIGLLLTGNLAMFVSIAQRGNWYVFLVSAGMLFLSYFIHLAWSHSLFLSPKVRLSALGISQRVGRYRGSQIYMMVQELLAPHRKKEIPRVYVTASKYDGAYAVNSLFCNFIGPLNAIYVSAHYFQILKPGEIKAILAHELAHFYKYMRPLNRVRFALMGFNCLFPVYLALDGGSISFWKALGIWVVFSYIFNRVVDLWLARTSRDHEYLCDLSAARRYGVLNIINGLIGSIRTSEIQAKIYRTLLNRIQRDKSLSIESLQKLVQQCEAALPATPVSNRQLDRLLKSVFKSDETKELRSRLSLKKQKEEKEKISKIVEQMMLNHEFKLIEWKQFDHIIPDGRLNRSEYERLIRTFEGFPTRQLFDLSFDNEEIAGNGSHPTLRERVLFLERARLSDPSICLSEGELVLEAAC